MTVLKFGSIKIEAELIAGSDGKESLHFRHPLTGAWCQSINTVMEDMEKYFEKRITEWKSLAEYINKDNDLHETVIDEVKEKEYFKDRRLL